ncbi:MAG: dUTP diphosphatase [Clostridia bacterium]|nr:dUTP diphosphatase [Clostridia bacterium]
MTVARFLHVSAGQYAADQCLPDALPLTDIPLPRRATAGSAGYDFVCTADVALAPGKAVTIPTGVRCEMHRDWVMMLYPRSSLGFKHQMLLANTVGVIDSDYAYTANEGHIMVRIINGGDHMLQISRGERFCQGVFLPYGTAEEDEVLAERTGGFGSTGK